MARSVPCETRACDTGRSPAVSTTLSRLTKSGEVLKAERGYRLP